MPAELIKFKHLRVYKNMTTMNIFNSMLCNRLMKMPTLVKHSRKLYNISSKLLGKGFVNAILTNTFCKILTAGNTLK
jgi:hypothetical protein